jgi:transcriptional regulator with XRE-family HTH domain
MEQRGVPADTFRATLAVRLALVRKAAGLTQIEVSDRLHRPRSWIGKLETARRSLLFSEAIELAELYGVPLSALDPGQNWPPS